jgi:hypothetical protein
MNDTSRQYLTELSDLALRLHKEAAKATGDDSKLDSIQRSLENFLDFVERAQAATADAAPFRFAHVAWPESTFRQIRVPPELRTASPEVLASFLTAMRQACGTSQPETHSNEQTKP